MYKMSVTLVGRSPRLHNVPPKEPRAYNLAMATAGYLTARTASEAIAAELRGGDSDFALRMVIRAVTDFRKIIAKEDADSIREFLQPPQSTGSIAWDTLLAASIGRECRLAGISRPKWTFPEPLATWWFVDPTPMLMARNMRRTPPDLECVGVWLDKSAFQVA